MATAVMIMILQLLTLAAAASSIRVANDLLNGKPQKSFQDSSDDISNHQKNNNYDNNSAQNESHESNSDADEIRRISEIEKLITLENLVKEKLLFQNTLRLIAIYEKIIEDLESL